jgi:cyclophilin family peptidyl-prolyl cis-trans isomerase/HEAT repeat protein
MKKFTTLFIITFALFHFSFSKATQREKIKTILEIQDLRKRNDKRLVTLLRDKDKEIRARAAIVCANLQDTTLVNELSKMLNDKESNVREAVAFAIGQTVSQMSDSGKTTFEKTMFEKKLFTSPRMLEEFGKFCTESGLPQFCETFATETESEKLEAIYLSLARAAIRNVKHAKATTFLLEQRFHSEDKLRRAKMYALQRIGRTSESEAAIDQILSFAEDSDAVVRMNCATLLGKFPDDAARTIPTIVTFAENDSDWRVRVNAIRSLGNLRALLYQGLLFSLMPLSKDSNEHVSLEAIRVLGNFTPEDSLHENLRTELWETLLSITQNRSGKYSIRQQGEAAVSFAKIFSEKAEGYALPYPKVAKNLNARCIEAQSYALTETSFRRLLDYASSTDALLARTAIDGLQNYFKQKPKETAKKNETYIKLIEMLDSNDIAVLTSVATLLGDSLFIHEISILPLIECYKKQTYPDGIEVMQEILSTLEKIKSGKAVAFLEEQLTFEDKTISLASAKALKEITGKDYSSKITKATKPLRTDFDWKFLWAMKETTEVELVTNKGNITLELYANEAPFTVMNFLKLAQTVIATHEKYFANTFFHRVVSNFVIQGGDPRGDGWGGPGFAIRSEFSLRKYDDVGIVGMASAGKDTEGSQFFITHSPTPHLDGRYTIFGKVVSGMEVVNNIFIWDQVVEVKIK